MNAQVTHRDRLARHDNHYKVDCLSMAPASVKARSRRSIRAAGRAATRHEAFEGLIEYLENIA